ncbi:MAG: LysE family translocator [Akkermansiaceae bacterium]|jgi:threonine efflux protein
MIGELLGFALVMLIGQFSPGPDMLLLTRTSLAEGLKAGCVMASGIATGLVVHSTIAISGVAALLSQGGWVTSVMTWLMAGYLLWLAFGLIQKPEEKSGEVEIPKRSPYFRGLLCNLLNPKAFVFLASVVAPFLTEVRPAWWPYAIGLIVVGQAIVFWSLWVWLLQNARVRKGYLRAGRGIDLVFAMALFGLAISLLL